MTTQHLSAAPTSPGTPAAGTPATSPTAATAAGTPVDQVDQVDQVEHAASYCPYFHHAVELIGRRWTGVVLLALSRSAERYSRLRQQIPGLSDRLLTERLTELEGEGIVERSEVDGATLYRLSDFGRELVPVIEAIEKFAHAAATRMGNVERPGRHRS